MADFRQRLRAARAQRAADRFHRWFYRNKRETWENMLWLGVPLWKCPFDLWVYQEIIHEQRPDVIVETGTAHGGSALYLADLCDLVGTGRVVTIDIEARPNRPAHPRITYLEGSSVSPASLEHISRLIDNAANAMVILDSDHHAPHVAEELRLYSPLVTKGQYLIVEDGNINGHPVHPNFGPGPFEAVTDFLARNRDFVRDESREKFRVTFNPCGYLRRVA
ncbi:MAG TPA: CmcI family methyltransferase [Candidatus Kryptonia bacterium]|nr:CmcI family methyltransferase [Candidatus Kryptonia bacterium]